MVLGSFLQGRSRLPLADSPVRVAAGWRLRVGSELARASRACTRLFHRPLKDCR